MSGQDLRKFMNLMESAKPGEFYADQEDGSWHVFHTETGKSYASFSDKDSADRDAAERNATLGKKPVSENGSIVAEQQPVASLNDDLMQIFNMGRRYEKTRDEDIMGDALNLIDEIVRDYTDVEESIAEETVMETGNGNAQQKGINFDGSKAAKGDGVLPRQAPKAKTSGNSAPLATAKSGTNVGNKKS